jgi:pimeloyl-ACP methyl ester carboxylesterase
VTAPRYLDTEQGRFAVLERGPDGGSPVLCLHGFPDHPPSLVPMMDRLAARGFRCAAPWMRGYAPSILDGPYDVDQLAADAAAVAGALWPGQRCHLVGHDWGAAATYAALQTMPDRFDRAVTMAVPHPLVFLRALRSPGQLRRSWYIFFFQLGGLADRAVAADGFRLVRRLWRAWSPGYRLADADWAELRTCLADSMPAPVDYYRAMFRPVGDATARIRDAAARPKIATPLLHLQGADDGCIAPSACRGQKPLFAGPFDSRIILGAGHFLALEQPDEIARHVADWLRDDA